MADGTGRQKWRALSDGYEPRGEARIPEWVLLHPDLDGDHVRLFGVLLTWRGRGDDAVWPKVETIAARVGYAPSKVRRLVSELEAVGAVKKEYRYDSRGYRTSNRYVLASAPPSAIGTALGNGQSGTPSAIGTAHGPPQVRHTALHTYGAQELNPKRTQSQENPPPPGGGGDDESNSNGSGPATGKHIAAARALITRLGTSDPRLSGLGGPACPLVGPAACLLAGGWPPERLTAGITTGLPKVLGNPVGLLLRRLRDPETLASYASTALSGLSNGRLPWCGTCAEDTRLIELPDGRPARCPDCNINARKDSA